MRRAAGIAALVLAGLGLAPAASAQEQGGPAFSTLPLPAIDPILVDAPCSGIRMLWVGMAMFCIGAARAGLRWRPFLAGFAVAVAVIVAANSVRCALVFVEEAGIAEVPEGWHTGVGLAVFACTGCLLLAFAGRLGTTRYRYLHVHEASST